jgi:hypothetical protein
LREGGISQSQRRRKRSSVAFLHPTPDGSMLWRKQSSLHRDKICGDVQVRSDRELARVIAEMFKGTELEASTVVAFPDQTLANKASKKWGDSYRGKMIVIDSKGKKTKSKSGGGGGFGAKPDASAQPKTSAVSQVLRSMEFGGEGYLGGGSFFYINFHVGLSCLPKQRRCCIPDLTTS